MLTPPSLPTVKIQDVLNTSTGLLRGVLDGQHDQTGTGFEG